MDERSAARVEVDKPVAVRIGGQVLRVLVYNLSTGGCMIDGADDDVLGQAATVQLGDGLTVGGVVVWQRGAHKGIRFSAPIEPDVVKALGFRPSEHLAWDFGMAAEEVGKKAPGADLRQHRRVSVDRHVMCECNDERAPVLLYDLSIGGCMFETEAEIPQVGQQVTVTLAGAAYPAMVVWAVGESIGASFTADLHPAIVEHYGFDPSAVKFEALKPKDRFGRQLPPLPASVRERGLM